MAPTAVQSAASATPSRLQMTAAVVPRVVLVMAVLLAAAVAAATPEAAIQRAATDRDAALRDDRLLLALAQQQTGDPAPLTFSVTRKESIVSTPEWFRRQLHRRRLSNASAADGEDIKAVNVVAELKEGYYWAYIQIGTPPKPFSVILDTGSTLTAVPCASCASCGAHMDPKFKPADSSTSVQVTCMSPQCPDACSSGMCHYRQAYAEGSSISGVYILDVLQLGLSDSGFKMQYLFGCHEQETNLFQYQKADGIMGLSRKPSTIINSLYAANVIPAPVFSLCLSSAGGQFVIGGINSTLHHGPVVYTAAVESGAGYHSVRLKDIWVAGVSLGVQASDYISGTGCIVDSGTTFTYLPDAAYRAFVTKVRSFCTGECTITRVSGEGDCFSLPSSFNMSQFPSMTLRLDEADVVIPAAAYLHQSQTHTNTWCIGVYSNGNDGTVIGGNIMRGYDVIFDMERARVGWAPAACGEVVCADCSAVAQPSTTSQKVIIIAASVCAVAAVLLVIGVILVRRAAPATRFRLLGQSDGNVDADIARSHATIPDLDSDLETGVEMPVVTTSAAPPQAQVTPKPVAPAAGLGDPDDTHDEPAKKLDLPSDDSVHADQVHASVSEK